MEKESPFYICNRESYGEAVEWLQAWVSLLSSTGQLPEKLVGKR
jgi:hypothetical protein